MPNKRELKLDKYGISSKRYKELCGFCEQYPDWKKELLQYSVVKSPIISDMPKAPMNNSDTTGEMAVRRCEKESKCTLIEETAIETSTEFAQYLIKSICYEVPVNYLISYEEMPLAKSQFYELRRKFFFILDKNKKY
jgi:hypothetical protein